jgi:glucan phosphoethanolaminetransferase (alkaline phosphatase superfamily)
MSLKSLFRTLVVVVPLLAIAALNYSYLAVPSLSDDWQTLLQWNGDGGWVPEDFSDQQTMTPAIIWAVIFGALVIAIILIQAGLFLFKSWARTANLIVTVLSILCVPFLGLAVYLPIEATLLELAAMAHYFIISLSYFSPLRREFTKKRKTSLKSPAPSSPPF